MALRGKGMLVTSSDVAAADEADFNEWYNREHIDERVALPGFRRARRYLAVEPTPFRYVGLYECTRVGDLANPDYLRLLANQTPWSQKVLATFTRFDRLTLRIRCDLAHGIGGAITLVRFVPAPGRGRALARFLAQEALPAAIARPGMLGAFAGENDLEVANAPARAQGLAYPQADAVEWLAVLEGATPEATRDAAALLDRAALAGFGVEAEPAAVSYRMQFAQQR